VPVKLPPRVMAELKRVVASLRKSSCTFRGATMTQVGNAVATGPITAIDSSP
jgi:hypothetical protein